jgi:hypothetical protein
MTATNDNANRMIDRLVDRELADDDLRQLLQECEDNPSQWRTMALAFVESQVMTNELLTLRDAADRRVEFAPSPGQSSAQSSHGRWSNLFSIAAIGLLVLGFGFGLGKFSESSSFDSQSPPNRVVEFNPASPNHALPTRVSPTHGDDSFQFVVSDPDGSWRQVEIPLVTDASDLRNIGTRSFPKELIEQMERRGRMVEQHRSFVPVILRDGRDAIVPIDNMRVKQKRYQ